MYLCVCKGSGHYFDKCFKDFFVGYMYIIRAAKCNIRICLKPDVIAERDKMFCKVIWRLH